jgi:hypothetical protein
LKDLPPQDRKRVGQTMATYPGLSAEKAIEMLLADNKMLADQWPCLA